ncbi:MFS transporter [Rhodococcus spongiicola]|uniref:MFS transporter n=1 Tax=Rhodococcus spongiicola TaxID=2487352 RepID=A0A3S3A5E9_9NOCA|nr:MFS transporter [Rhodococcus spongiicola]RVW02441.1 MFS transporter [Rhodococcus spongiicola]
MTDRDTRGLLPLLTAAMAIGPLLTYGLSATSALVIDSLDITVAQFGMLATLTFLTAAALALAFSHVGDHFSTRGLLVTVFVGAAMSYVLAALSTNYLWLLGAMALSGAAQALSNPVTNRVISERAPQPKRAQWIGVKQSGVQVAQLVAGAGCPVLALAWGWRGALWIGAVVAGASALVAWRRSPSSHSPHSPQASKQVATSVNALRTTGSRARSMPRAVWVLAAYALFSGTGVQATNVYLPLFALEGMGLTLTAAGLTAAIAGAIGVTSRIFWGRALSGKIDTFVLLLILASGSTLGALALLMAQLVGWLPLLWLGVTLHGATALAANVLLMAGVLRVVGTTAVGRASSLIAVGMYLGFAGGPALTGFLFDVTAGFAAGWMVAAMMYAACALLCIWGVRTTPADMEPAMPVEADRLTR